MLYWRTVYHGGENPWWQVTRPTLRCRTWRILGLPHFRHSPSNLLKHRVHRRAMSPRQIRGFIDGHQWLQKQPNPVSSINLQHSHYCWFQCYWGNDHQICLSSSEIDNRHVQNHGYMGSIPLAWQGKVPRWLTRWICYSHFRNPSLQWNHRSPNWIYELKHEGKHRAKREGWSCKKPS